MNQKQNFDIHKNQRKQCPFTTTGRHFGRGGVIYEHRYDQYLRNEGRNKIWAYGIAFYNKRCKVITKRLGEENES